MSAESAEVDEHFREEFAVIAADHIAGQVGKIAVLVRDEQVAELVLFLGRKAVDEGIVGILRSVVRGRRRRCGRGLRKDGRRRGLIGRRRSGSGFGRGLGFDALRKRRHAAFEFAHGRLCLRLRRGHGNGRRGFCLYGLLLLRGSRVIGHRVEGHHRLLTVHRGRHVHRHVLRRLRLGGLGLHVHRHVSGNVLRALRDHAARGGGSRCGSRCGLRLRICGADGFALFLRFHSAGGGRLRNGDDDGEQERRKGSRKQQNGVEKIFFKVRPFEHEPVGDHGADRRGEQKPVAYRVEHIRLFRGQTDGRCEEVEREEGEQGDRGEGEEDLFFDVRRHQKHHRGARVAEGVDAERGEQEQDEVQKPHSLAARKRGDHQADERNARHDRGGDVEHHAGESVPPDEETRREERIGEEPAVAEQNAHKARYRTVFRRFARAETHNEGDEGDHDRRGSHQRGEELGKSRHVERVAEEPFDIRPYAHFVDGLRVLDQVIDQRSAQRGALGGRVHPMGEDIRPFDEEPQKEPARRKDEGDDRECAISACGYALLGRLSGNCLLVPIVAHNFTLRERICKKCGIPHNFPWLTTLYHTMYGVSIQIP